jgi:putative ABC transport system ATP-binding protein
MVTTAREEGTTVLIVTHDARVAAYAGRTVLVRDGKVLTPAEAEDEVKVGG